MSVETFVPTSSHGGMICCIGESGRWVQLKDYVELRQALAAEKALREKAEKQRDAFRRELDEMAAPSPVPAESDPPRTWTRQDAFERVVRAQIGYLDPQRVSLEYLNALREFLYPWIEEIEGEISRRSKHSDDLQEV